MLALLAIMPLLVAALLAPLLGEHFDIIRYLALIASIISLAMVILLGASPGMVQSVTWFSVAGYSFHITTQTYPLNMLLLYLIGIITPLIILYSIGYMDKPSEQARYYFELLVFASAMMFFAMSGNFITMFIGWEMLGITSYLLIGFWHYKKAAPLAARKAITIVFLGDMLMLAAMVIIWVTYGTFSFSYIVNAPSSPALIVAMALVMLAAFTKSAQFPFHEWLPDAMEGPTPVSAFLHSSTMVKAGVFIIAVLLPVYMDLHMGWLLILFGAITALLGILNALTETHIKRILAYSTIEDMGLMFMALGFGSLIGAMLLFIAQAFYKALLFMSAGTIMKANDDSTSIYKSYSSSSYKPFFIVLLIGALSIAGIFPLSGFFGKLGVEIPATSIYVYILLLVMDFASSIYIFRWLLIPMRRPGSDYSEAQLRMNYKLTPKSMLVPQYILAAIVLIAGILYVYVPGYLASYGGSSIYMTIMPAVIESALVIIGIIVALYLFKFHMHKSSFSEKHRGIFTIMYNSIMTNAFYNYTALAFSKLSKIFDLFDYSLYGFIKAGGRSFIMFGNFIRKVENGQINTYALAFIIGFIILLIMVLGI